MGGFYGAAAISGVFDADLPTDKRVAGDEKLALIQSSFGNLMRKRLSDSAGHLPYGGSLKGLLSERSGPWPELLFFCGKEDFLSLAQTNEFYKICVRNDLSCYKNTEINGSHDLDYWRKAFPLAVKMLLDKKLS